MVIIVTMAGLCMLSHEGRSGHFVIQRQVRACGYYTKTDQCLG